MIKVLAKIYKYGDFREEKEWVYDSESDFYNSMTEGLEYKADLDAKSDEYGEELSKWSARLNYKGKDYTIYLDY